MGNQSKRTVDIGQTNQIAEWRESNNAWSATSFLSKNKTFQSAIGPKRTSLVAPHMSAFGGKADIGQTSLSVCF